MYSACAFTDQAAVSIRQSSSRASQETMNASRISARVPASGDWQKYRNFVPNEMPRPGRLESPDRAR